MRAQLTLGVILTGSCLSACAAAPVRERAFPFPAGKLAVTGTKIYHGGKLFAELRFLVPEGHGDWTKDGFYRGFAMYYQQYAKEVWICPEGGWGVRDGGKSSYSVSEVKRAWNGPGDNRKLTIGGDVPGDLRFATAQCFDITISPDGHVVHYMKSGVFSPSTYKYLVEYAVSEEQ